MTMTSSRPYMLRALYEWIVDNKTTPYILVDAYCNGVSVPQQHVDKDGRVVLNISPTAISGLVMDNESLSFSARFGGVPTDIYVPSAGILGVYAKENGQGMMFEPEENPQPEPDPPQPLKSKKPERPSLRVIK